MKLTLDTNCLINHFDTESMTATSRDEVATLIRYATSGRIQLVVTTRAEADLDEDKNDERRARLKSYLVMFEVIPSVIRWDESSWDGGDVWADGNGGRLADEIQKVLFPGLDRSSNTFRNKIRDVDHITAHVMDRRDIFVTDDGRLNQRAEQLKKLGAVVMRPGECVAYIESLAHRSQPQSLTSASSAEYRDQRLEGVVTFDYSNNDGRFTIGEGHFLFETDWSKASDTSIYALRDPPSIDGLALVKDGRMADITDAGAYDYSSRHRKARIGQIVLWRNTNGIFAATKILAIADDSRGASHDELTFEFRILTEGTSFA
jgi:hypothetical protein